MAAPSVVTLRRDFARPDAATVARFAGLPTGYLTDALGRRGALTAQIRPVGRFAPFVGVALTVSETTGSNLALGVAMGEMQPGDVLMIAAEGFAEAAIFGGNIVGMCRNGQIAGMVIDGAVRDAEEIEQIGLPVFARSVTPNSPFKHGPGAVGGAIVVGGVAVRSGDIVAGDRDGVVVVPQERIAETLAALEGVKAKEAKQDQGIAGGLIVPEWLAEFRAQGGVKVIG